MNHITDLCRQLRNNPTHTEKLLWKELKKRNAGGVKFLRQFPIFVSYNAGMKAFYIADFYCASLKLVIEVDGPIHLLKKEYDDNRDLAMQELGLNIIRFTNAEVIENIDGDLERIMFNVIA
jgi:very-short-patch-repair endonuclease